MGRCAALAVLVVLLPAPAAQAAWPGSNGQLLWSSGGDIWTDAGRLTDTPQEEAQGTWAPSGDVVALRLGTSPHRIGVGSSSGGGFSSIGGSAFHESQPAFSADGTRIFYRRSVPGENFSGDIWSMRRDGTEQRPEVESPSDERYPSPSPDGTRLAYTSNAGGDYEIHVDGTPLTVNDVFDSAPSWSPDGTRIAFERGPGGDSPGNEVWTLSAWGGDEGRLTSDSTLDEGPAWSPDGTQIAFTSARDGDSEIWRMPAGGGAATQVTDAPGVEESPDWGPAPRPSGCSGCGPQQPPDPSSSGPQSQPQPGTTPASVDVDRDDDGLSDARERRIGTSPLRRDTDRDGLHDGQELGVARPLRATDSRRFRADADPRTRTSPLRRDTDRDGLADGREDRNRNGRRDRGETDPRRRDTDRDGLSDRRDARPTTPRRGS